MLGPDIDDDLVDDTATIPAAAAETGEDDSEYTLPPLVPGDPMPQALAAVWRGDRIVVVDAPPGAGKTSLIASLVAQLCHRSELTIAVATPTRAQALGIAARLATTCPEGTVVLGDKRVEAQDVPEGVVYDPNGVLPGRGTDGTVVVRNLKAWKHRSRAQRHIDVMVVDEAYQATYKGILDVAAGVEQFLLVGDPGQIGPVVSVNTKMWDGDRDAPNLRAPDVLGRRDDATRVRMRSTYRLGPDTARIIAPMYDFAFDSRRPDTRLDGLPEVASLRVAAASGKDDMRILRTVAERAASMIGRTVTVADEDGRPGEQRALTAADVAVVVAHNTQRSAIQAYLAADGIEGVTVGTADKLQGGQWHAVVALDPLVGQENASGHGGSIGRLCVMVSRHRAHLLWVHDGTWRDVIDGDDELDATDRRVGLTVRKSLAAAPAAL